MFFKTIILKIKTYKLVLKEKMLFKFEIFKGLDLGGLYLGGRPHISS